MNAPSIRLIVLTVQLQLLLLLLLLRLAPAAVRLAPSLSTLSSSYSVRISLYAPSIRLIILTVQLQLFLLLLLRLALAAVGSLLPFVYNYNLQAIWLPTSHLDSNDTPRPSNNVFTPNLLELPLKVKQPPSIKEPSSDGSWCLRNAYIIAAITAGVAQPQRRIILSRKINTL